MKNEKVTDFDGNEYKTVKIGTQVWMKENLCVTHYCNGDPIQLVTDRDVWAMMTRGAFFNYSKGDISCYMYNWFAVSEIRGLAPEGWHVPTDKEWRVLVRHLGGKGIAGGKLKAKGTKYWEPPNQGADNSSGFKALPFGFKSLVTNHHAGLGEGAHFWTASDRKFGGAIYRVLGANFKRVNRFVDSKNYGLSVRCIKDS
jgi:uncharacterized protein (TIGR02145 family)